MPKYLGKDYFQQASVNYQNLLYEALLPEVNFLEKSNMYPHQATIEDDSYRMPWKYVQPFPLVIEKDVLKNQLSSLSKLLYEELIIPDKCIKPAFTTKFSYSMINNLELRNLDEIRENLDLDDNCQIPQIFLNSIDELGIDSILKKYLKKQKNFKPYELDNKLLDDNEDIIIKQLLAEYKSNIPRKKFESMELIQDFSFIELPELFPDLIIDLQSLNLKKSSDFLILNNKNNTKGNNNNDGISEINSKFSKDNISVVNKLYSKRNHSSFDMKNQDIINTVKTDPIKSFNEHTEMHTNYTTGTLKKKLNLNNDNCVQSNCLHKNLSNFYFKIQQNKNLTDKVLYDSDGELSILYLAENLKNVIDQLLCFSHNNNPSVSNKKYITENSVVFEDYKIFYNKKEKEQIIKVKISGEYKHAYDCIQKYIKKLIEESLEYRNDTLMFKTGNKLYQFKDLLLNKNNIPNFQLKDQDTEEIYYKLVAIYHLVNCQENLLHYHIAVATEYLERYTSCDLLKDYLKNPSQDILKIKLNLEISNCLHPKMLALCQYLIRELQLEKKIFLILIIVKNHSERICPIIKSLLEKIVGIEVRLFLKEKMFLNTKPETTTVVICKEIIDEISLSFFSVIMEYDTVNTFWKNHNKKEKVNYILFDVEIDAENSKLNKIENEEGESFVIIGSTKITRDLSLLRILENSYNFTLIERDYRKFNSSSNKKILYFTDVIIDRSTGIFIESYKSIIINNELDKLNRKIKCLSLKYEVCWLIIAVEEADSKKILHVLKNLPFLKSMNRFKLEVRQAQNIVEVAELIFQICKQIHINEVHKETIVNSHWLSPIMTKEEEFLISLPCLNSYCAQEMLFYASLNEILTMTWIELKTQYNKIPNKILTLFYHLASQPAVLREAGLLSPSSLEFKEMNNYQMLTSVTNNGLLSDMSSDTASPINSNKEMNSPYSNNVNRFDEYANLESHCHSLENEFCEKINPEIPNFTKYDVSYFGKCSTVICQKTKSPIEKQISKKKITEGKNSSQFSSENNINHLINLNKKFCNNSNFKRIVKDTDLLDNNSIEQSFQLTGYENLRTSEKKPKMKNNFGLKTIGIAHPFVHNNEDECDEQI